MIILFNMINELSDATHENLVKLLILFAEAERKVGIVKQILAELPDFSPDACFAYLERSRKGRISVSDISEFLISHDANYT